MFDLRAKLQVKLKELKKLDKKALKVELNDI
jgi:hypothetical protein